jgi:hypothetical protein
MKKYSTSLRVASSGAKSTSNDTVFHASKNTIPWEDKHVLKS